MPAQARDVAADGLVRGPWCPAALSQLPTGHRRRQRRQSRACPAWAASLYGLRATVVVSEQASPAKIAKLRAQPISSSCTVTPTPPRPSRRPSSVGLELCLAVQRHPRHRRRRRSGRARGQTSGPLTLVVPVGGGGLLTRAALWARWRRDDDPDGRRDLRFAGRRRRWQRPRRPCRLLGTRRRPGRQYRSRLRDRAVAVERGTCVDEARSGPRCDG